MTITDRKKGTDTPNGGADSELIHSYSRKEAIEDGVLVDLSAVAPEICRQHFKYPIACTAGVWGVIERAIAKGGSDLNGVVHDILWMAIKAGRPVAESARVREEGRNDSTRLFDVLITGNAPRQRFEFKIVCGPGDTPEPVLTIMFPEED